MRLADIRVSRYWLWSLLAAALLVRRKDRRAEKASAQTGRDLGEVVVNRWKATDARDRRLVWLTLAVLVVSVASLLVGILALAIK